VGVASGGHLEVLLWARANGCPWHEKTLNIAAHFGHEMVVRSLIEAGADINKARDIGATPLYVGAQFGHETVVRALIEAGADINKARDIGGTPLSIAAQKGQEATVQILRDAAAVL
jgi:cytohesin